MMVISALSRRDVTRSAVWLVGCLFGPSLHAGPVPTASLPITLAREFDNTALRAISPDGTKLCLEDWKAPGYPIRVVEVGTWATLYTGHFEQRALSVGFFADSLALFLDFAGGKGQLAERQVVVELQSGGRTERMRALDPFHFWEQVFPINDRTLLVVHGEISPPRAAGWLARLEFPSYREVAKAELLDPRNGPRAKADAIVSDDRRIAVYLLGNDVVCRRIQDFQTLWTHPIAVEFSTYSPAVSASGGHVAAIFGTATPHGQFERSVAQYICVYEGTTGSEIARLPSGGAERIAISPDGTLLALAVSEQGNKGEILPVVHIHDVASGVRVASVVHDRIPGGRRQWLLAGCTAAFTSDGKYLITGGMVTKAWRIGGPMKRQAGVVARQNPL